MKSERNYKTPDIDFSNSFTVKDLQKNETQNEYFVDLALPLIDKDELYNRTNIADMTGINSEQALTDPNNKLIIRYNEGELHAGLFHSEIVNGEAKLIAEDTIPINDYERNVLNENFQKVIAEYEKGKISMEIDFTNKVDEHEEVVDEGDINAMVSLNDNELEELYKRGNFEEKTGMTFNEMLKESDMLMNVYAVKDRTEDEMQLYVTCSDYNAYEDGYIPLTPNERETLTTDVDRAIEARGEQDYLKEAEEEDKSEQDVDLD